ncbi:molybdate ABC transporter substrate-binding protein [Neisseria sp. Ec49-e6-T10]|uniref:molybdate ABC transporter substrate-binding protein n=1 Tax=Neisseria sp. Ec49-e6-T10 TaxID=3140744 RepID=UPI003EBE0D9C
MKNIKLIKVILGSMLFILLQTSSFAEEITVSAAASLTDSFKEIVKNYEAKHPNSKVLLNFGASGSLLQQIDKGAPVDIFASADQDTMNQAQNKKLIALNTRVNFVKNSLVVIVPMKSNLTINHLSDLQKGNIKRIALGNPASVPVGRYSKTALEKNNAWVGIQDKVIHTQNVRQSLDYVARGEVDAGFVYGTDANIMKDKVKVIYTVALDTPITYPIAQISRSKNKNEANRFINYVLSTEGQTVLKKYGFVKPN